jgi:hypothetical protein
MESMDVYGQVYSSLPYLSILDYCNFFLPLEIVGKRWKKKDEGRVLPWEKRACRL